MNEVVVFDRVWKKFRRGERHDSLRDLLPAMARQLFRRGISSDLENIEEFWALKDVSFAVAPGEALGIIGPNGAGKSTILKLLTRILKPTRGACEVRGRVGALIEVAAGFHPDLTGRENIFLQGAIMGMRRTEIASKLDDIVEFAGVGEFIDTPVKRYSSGMNARLGFSIAAHLDPDVLLIDEVLGVGDLAFQERCLKRMLEFKRKGIATVFVSHHLQAVALLCDRTIFIRNEVITAGDTHSVLEAYVRQAHDIRPSDQMAHVVLTDSSLESALGRCDQVPPGTPMLLRLAFEARCSISDVTFCLVVHRSTDLLTVYHGNFTSEELGIGEVQPGELLTVAFQFNANVLRGLYHIECVVLDTMTQAHLNTVFPVAAFSILDSRAWSGVADLAVSASVRLEGSTRMARDASRAQ